jgi:hypothetical protein
VLSPSFNSQSWYSLSLCFPLIGENMIKSRGCNTSDVCAGRGIVITLRFRHSSSNCFDKCIEWLSNSRIRYCVPEGFVCGKNISVNHQYAISSLIQAVGSAAYLYGGGSCGAQSILTLIPSKMTSGCIQVTPAEIHSTAAWPMIDSKRYWVSSQLIGPYCIVNCSCS